MVTNLYIYLFGLHFHKYKWKTNSEDGEIVCEFEGAHVLVWGWHLAPVCGPHMLAKAKVLVPHGGQVISSGYERLMDLFQVGHVSSVLWNLL